MADVVQVLVPGNTVQVINTSPQIVEVVSVGPQGPPGAGSAVVFTESVSLSQWHFTHTLGRRPNVTVYDGSGNVVLADVNATSTDVTITLANAGTGSVVLN